MLILVTMRTAPSTTYVEMRDAISYDWSTLFAVYGFVPVLVPNATQDVRPYLALGARGLLLTGGDDLGSEDAPTARDRCEAELVSAALAGRLPIFGVCRGLQVLNRHFGGAVARSLPETHVGDHDIELESGRITRVNSFHDCGVLRTGIAPDLGVLAATERGVVEGVRHRSLPVTAIQWHPERGNPDRELDRLFLDDWKRQCASSS